MELGFISDIFNQAIGVLNNILEKIDGGDVIALIGATAWIPAIVQIIYSVREKKEIENRTISIQLVDTKVFYNTSTNECRNHANLSKPGSVVLLATNIFVPEKSFFVGSYSIKLKLSNIKEPIIADIIGNVDIVNTNYQLYRLTIPNKYNFNLHREIICEKDNLRVFAIFVEHYNIMSDKNIEWIEFEFKGTEDTKKVTLEKESISTYVRCNFLSAESCYINIQ